MKRKNIINKFFIAGALAMGAGFVSCEDYLTVLPTDRITEDDFWKSKADLNNVRAAAYNQMASTGITDRIIYWGELRGDNFSQNDMTRTNVDLLRRGVLHPTEGYFDWAPFYKGINYCNKVLEQGDLMTVPGKEVDPSFRKGDWLPIKAEMLSMRALYYFYLVKAYRNVPFVTHSISTDAEARANRIAATSGTVILMDAIKDLEEAKIYAASDYSNAVDRKGRFTKRGVRALLADLYLWSGCMMRNSQLKGDTIVVKMDSTEVSDTLSNAKLNAMSLEYFEKAIENCDFILNDINKDYEEDLVQHPEWKNDQDRIAAFPYMSFLSTRQEKAVYDEVYSNLFGRKNSDYEGIFELQYDGVNLKNGTYGTFFSSYESSLSPKVMVGSQLMTSNAGSNYNPTRGFGKSDIRLIETFKYSTSQSQNSPFHKNVAKSVIIPNLGFVIDPEVPIDNNDYRTSNSQDANWPVYRLSDVMLIKAEAIARSFASTFTMPDAENKIDENDANQKKLMEGFNLVNSIFQRSNPGLKNQNNTEITNNDRVRFKTAKAFSVAKSSVDLLKMVYNERQLEFVGEGKRWFDVVRQAEHDYSTSNQNDVAVSLSDFITLSKEVQSRLRLLWSMYVPIYSEELKVNGVEYGGMLKQNPVWDRYTVK